MKTTNSRVGTTYTQTHTQTSKQGFTTFQKTGDTKQDHFLAQLEDALSFFYYSDLKNEQGMLSPELDLEQAKRFFKDALETLEEC